MTSATRGGRNPNSAARSPSPSEVLNARLLALMTPEQAGALVYERGKRWTAWERGEARMHPAVWELWRNKVNT